MSYHRKHQGLGGTTTSTTVATLTAAADVLKDPYLVETVCRVSQLAALENRRPVPPCATTKPGLVGGVGLRKVMPPLRAYVRAEQAPWMYAVAATAVIGIPLLLGLALGRSR